MSDLEDNLCIQIKREGLPIPTREYRFHPQRRWKFDFAYPVLKIAFEVEGGIWQGKSGHNTGAGILRDIEKYNTATLMGWRVFRIHGEMIMKKDRQMDEGWQLIQEALACRLPDVGPSTFDAPPTPSKPDC